MFSFFGCSMTDNEIEKENKEIKTKHKKCKKAYVISTLKIKSLIENCSEYKEAHAIIIQLKRETPYASNYEYADSFINSEGFFPFIYEKIYKVKPRLIEQNTFFQLSQTTIGKHIKIRRLTHDCELILTNDQLKLYEKLKNIQEQNVTRSLDKTAPR